MTWKNSLKFSEQKVETQKKTPKETGTGYSCGSKRGHRKGPSFQRVMGLGLTRKLAGAAPSSSMLNLGGVHKNAANLGSKELQTSFSVLCPTPQSLQSIEKRLQKKVSTQWAAQEKARCWAWL